VVDDYYVPANVSQEERRRRLCALLDGNGVSTIVTAKEPDLDPEISTFRRARLLAGPVAFQVATRNPYNSGWSYALTAYEVSGGCKKGNAASLDATEDDVLP